MIAIQSVITYNLQTLEVISIVKVNNFISQTQTAVMPPYTILITNKEDAVYIENNKMYLEVKYSKKINQSDIFVKN